MVTKHPLKLADACYPSALDVEGQRVFVGCRNKPMVVVLDAKRHRLYAACGDGVLAVLEERDGKSTLVEKVPTAGLARTCLFDPDGDRLYVVLPKSWSGEPTLRVYQPQP